MVWVSPPVRLGRLIGWAETFENQVGERLARPHFTDRLTP
jgi:hypothetical protein